MATKKTTAKKPAKKTSAKAVKTEVTEQASSVYETLNSNLESAQEIAKKAWFAYLGVFGRSFDEVTSRVEKAREDLNSRYSQLTTDGQKFVDDLVSRGEKVQDEAEAKLNEGRASIEEQIEVAKNRISEITPELKISETLKTVSDKLESLSKDIKKAA